MYPVVPASVLGSNGGSGASLKQTNVFGMAMILFLLFQLPLIRKR